jgi:hypothetical protein
MRRIAFLTSIAFALACSRETPAPPSAATTTTAAPAPPVATPQVPQLQKGTYDEALLWFRSTPAFHFVLDEGSLHAEGEVTRSTPGAERVVVRANGKEWLAEAGAQGVTWKSGSGDQWTATTAPDFGNRVYQRVTIAFDPQKKEGVPLLVSGEGATNLYRFTNANTGEVHEVWVRKSDNAIERIKIGETVDLRLSSQ